MMTTPVAMPATQELLDLAARTRPDINRTDLEGAILDATRAHGWPWTLAHTARMLARGEEPRDLRAASADPAHTRSRRTTR